MRRTGAPSELGRLAAPVIQLFDRVWQRMHWWIGAMAVFYALSGITIIKSDEVAVVLRWGRLVGPTRALQEHGPGILFAFPRPIDQIVRVPVKHVWETPVRTLSFGKNERPAQFDPTQEDEMPAPESSDFTINPLTEGYALTGDHNIVQVDMIARYRVRDAAQWALYGPKAEDSLRVEVTSAMVRSLGETRVDSVLSDGRKALIATATQRAQEGLDAIQSGLELTSLELTHLGPPSVLAGDFDAVQSAFIGAETKQKDAQAFAAKTIPSAQSQVDAALQAAHAAAAADLASARGEAEAFRALEREYRANRVVVRERLYRDAVEKAIGASGGVRWIPPPIGGHYNGFRITLGGPGGGLSPEDDRDQ